MSRYTLIGAGALGILFAVRLARTGVSVEMAVRREEQASLIAGRGLSLLEAGEHELVAEPSVRLLSDPTVRVRGGIKEAEDAGRADGPHFIILAVKQHAITLELAESIRGLMGPDTWVVCLQNGIGHAEKLARSIHPERLLLAVTTEAALRLSDRASSHTGQGETHIGSFTDGLEAQLSQAAKKKLVKELEMAGFRSFLSNNIKSRIWQKLLINAAINPLTAILQVHNGTLLELDGALELMHELVNEGTRLAEAYGIGLENDLWLTVREVCTRTAANRSSMLQDLGAERPTEIEAITGSMLELARESGLELRSHQSVYLLVKALESRKAAND
ncbi:2-dehydropantoate 2-reductase [Paenibacillus filicis]|uniref:2-dehydropantoate 2-reductase n=1 Tax=Paenibacillus filicis TaxID=669464 RepID=A0ABU9DNC8_9BACL